MGRVDDEVIAAFDQHGWAVLPGVLSPEEVTSTRSALRTAATASEAAGMPVRIDALDPGGCNIRVYDLVAHHELFADLAEHPLALAHVEVLLGHDVILSNFTANTALPGSGSMNAHNDTSTVVPEPWPERVAMNAIWCLDDTDEANGATRFLPGSHRWATFDEVPDDPKANMVPFEATAGAVILMDGRLWHTSGENSSADRERALLFAFYTRSFIRPQNNWWRVIPRERRRELSPRLRELLCFDAGNMTHGTYLAE